MTSHLSAANSFFSSYIMGLICFIIACPTPSRATIYPLPPDGVDLIGQTVTIEARFEDTLLDIARDHDIGQHEILLANPTVDRWLPGDGTKVLLPSQFILPRTPKEGVVINIPEMRLYYYYRDKKTNKPIVNTYPVSVGKMDWSTPMGHFRISTKEFDPIWRPPESIRKEAKATGKPLPDFIPPGPGNPLGHHALRLSVPEYLIHGTNKPYGVGMRVTHGCVRMYPEDIEELFTIIPTQTPVRIVNEPIKVGWKDDILYIEVHPSIEESSEPQMNQKYLAYKMIFS